MNHLQLTDDEVIHLLLALSCVESELPEHKSVRDKLRSAAPQPAEQQPAPDVAGGPMARHHVTVCYEDCLCEHGNGCKLEAECGFHPQPAQQGSAPDVAKLQRNVSEAHKREEALEAYIRELQSRKFVKFAGEECWVWQGDGSDNLERLVCPVVIRPGDLMEIINRSQTSPDVAAEAESLRQALQLAADRLDRIGLEFPTHDKRYEWARRWAEEAYLLLERVAQPTRSGRGSDALWTVDQRGE